MVRENRCFQGVLSLFSAVAFLIRNTRRNSLINCPIYQLSHSIHGVNKFKFLHEIYRAYFEEQFGECFIGKAA